jgi:hypothetical protein
MAGRMTVKSVTGRKTVKVFEHSKEACRVAGGKINSDKVQAVSVVCFHDGSPDRLILDFDKAIPYKEWIRPTHPQ